ncbi:hypothetical protein BH11PSE8_BH11PSE8_11430 [soil metagenome]
MKNIWRNRPAAGALAAAALAMTALAGCAVVLPGSLPPGTSIDQARRSFGGPMGEYPLADGGRRLEFPGGYRQTLMVDFDAAGRLVRSEQVLDEANFSDIVPGMAREEVLMRIGHPVYVFAVPRQHLQVWNYRFFRGDCVWFQVSVGDEGTVTEAGMGTDPACDGPSRDN